MAVRAAGAQAIRLAVLTLLLVALPTTSGWVTVYVLAGVTVLLTGLCCCSCCCECPGCDCDCGDCDCGGGGCCCEGDDSGSGGDPCCGDCCGGSSEGSQSGDGGGGGGGSGGDCGCVTEAGWEGAAVQGMLLAWPMLRSLPPRTRHLLDRALAHHPRRPAYEQDVYWLGGMRLCIGCWTTYPLFIAVSAWLALTAPGPWSAWLLGGLALASMQALSAAGWTTTRRRKIAVKGALGCGLASFVHGVLQAPWPHAAQIAALVGALAAALLTTLPRRRRMRARMDA